MRVEIWSDVVCPWCYIGKRRFETALAAFEHRDDVEVTYRSFRLDPAATSDLEGEASPSHLDVLAAKFGTDRGQVERMLGEMVERGAADGIEFRFDTVRAANTVDAHRLLHLAADRGVAVATADRFFRAVFTDGVPIGDPVALRRVAVDAGLDPADVDAVLGSDRYAADVAADLEQARAYGISGVPFFVLDGRLGVSGAQPVEVLSSALDQAWTSREGVSAG